MKIPKSIKIGNVDYTINFVGPRAIDDHNDPETEYHGRFFPSCDLIQIRDTMSGERQYSTFIHECLHAIFYEYGIDVGDEEMFARQLTIGIIQLINGVNDVSV